MTFTLDWDNISKKTMNRRIDKLKQVVQFNRLRVYQSASKKGYHIEVFGVNGNWEDNVYLRNMLWDDKKRLEIDKDRKLKGICCNILFDKKYLGESKLLHVIYPF